MPSIRFMIGVCCACALLVMGPHAFVQAQTPSQEQAQLSLFAVEIRTGPQWDAGKAPQDQRYFRDHSANLKRLRDAGKIVTGARYSNIGLLVIEAENENQVREMMDEDPSIIAKVFEYQVHAFDVFYPGTLNRRPGGAASK